MIGLKGDSLRRLFEATLRRKAAHSLTWVMAGLLLHLVPQAAITTLVRRLTWADLMEDPGDLVDRMDRHQDDGAAEPYRAAPLRMRAHHLLLEIAA